MKIIALDAATLDFPDEEWFGLRNSGELTLFELTPHEPEAVIKRCGDAQIVLTNKVPFPASVIEQLEHLKLISVLATGYNIVDLEAARQKGIVVSNVPDYSASSVAQHTVALALELCNTVGLHNASVKIGDWIRSPRFSYWKKAPVELEGLTVGLVGFGSIGRRVGSIFNAMGAQVLAYVRTPRNAPDWEGFAWANSVEELFENSDLISLHCPQTPENTGFVNKQLISRMNPEAFLVNTARGGLVNEAELAEALSNELLAGYAADVIASEPMKPDNPIVKAPNTILTPHMAWASTQSRRRLIETTRQNIESFLAGNPVNTVS